MKDNKLIAEFMGMTPHEQDGGCVIQMTHQGNEVVLVSSLKYHTSWDWLMPVVEKIESLGYELIIAESRCKINHNTDHSIEEVINIDIVGNKREATYKAVVEFIKEQKS